MGGMYTSKEYDCKIKAAISFLETILIYEITRLLE